MLEEETVFRQRVRAAARGVSPGARFCPAPPPPPRPHPPPSRRPRPAPPRAQARLFVMKNESWHEEGQGDIKVLKHIASGRSRLVMRKDRSTLILLNQLVQVEAALTNHKSEDTNSAERAFVFEAEDYATGACGTLARLRASARACARGGQPQTRGLSRARRSSPIADL